MSYYNLEDYAKAVSFFYKKQLPKMIKMQRLTILLAGLYLELENEKNAIPQFQKAVEIETGQK